MSGGGRLDGAVCAVTGASSGIGGAVAAALASRGGRVVGFARRFEADNAAPPAAGSVREVRLDVTREQEVAARFAELGGEPGTHSPSSPSGALGTDSTRSTFAAGTAAAGPIDVVVLAAGIGRFSSLADAGAGDLRDMLEVHVTATLLCAREAMRHMRKRGRGHIIVIGSVAATRALAGSAGYGAAKAGQRALARAAAEEGRAHGIAVTHAALGAVDTPLWDARPGFDRAHMLRAADVAEIIADVAARTFAAPSLAVEEIVIRPRRGDL